MSYRHFAIVAVLRCVKCVCVSATGTLTVGARNSTSACDITSTAILFAVAQHTFYSPRSFAWANESSPFPVFFIYTGLELIDRITCLLDATGFTFASINDILRCTLSTKLSAAKNSVCVTRRPTLVSSRFLRINKKECVCWEAYFMGLHKITADFHDGYTGSKLMSLGFAPLFRISWSNFRGQIGKRNVAGTLIICVSSALLTLKRLVVYSIFLQLQSWCSPVMNVRWLYCFPIRGTSWLICLVQPVYHSWQEDRKTGSSTVAIFVFQFCIKFLKCNLSWGYFVMRCSLLLLLLRNSCCSFAFMNAPWSVVITILLKTVIVLRAASVRYPLPLGYFNACHRCLVN